MESKQSIISKPSILSHPLIIISVTPNLRETKARQKKDDSPTPCSQERTNATPTLKFYNNQIFGLPLKVRNVSVDIVKTANKTF